MSDSLGSTHRSKIDAFDRVEGLTDLPDALEHPLSLRIKLSAVLLIGAYGIGGGAS